MPPQRPGAPMRTVEPAELAELLESPRIEKGVRVNLASHHPDAFVRKEGWRWVVRRLVRTEATQKKAEAALAAGEGWMPEHEAAATEPGPVWFWAFTARGLLRRARRLGRSR